MAKSTLKAMLAITALCLRPSSASFPGEDVKVVDRTTSRRTTSEEESSLMEFLENHQLVEDVDRMAAAQSRLEASVAANSYRIKESARQERAARRQRAQRDEEGLLKLEMEMLQTEESGRDANGEGGEADMVWVDSVWDFEGVEDSEPVEGPEVEHSPQQMIRGGLRGSTDLR